MSLQGESTQSLSPVKRRVVIEQQMLESDNQKDESYHLNIFPAHTFKHLDQMAKRVSLYDKQQKLSFQGQYESNSPQGILQRNQKQDSILKNKHFLYPKNFNQSNGSLESQEQQQQDYTQTNNNKKGRSYTTNHNISQFNITQGQYKKEYEFKPLPKTSNKSSLDTGIDLEQLKRIDEEKEKKIQEQNMFPFSNKSHDDFNYEQVGRKILKEKQMKRFYVPPVQEYNVKQYKKSFLKENYSNSGSQIMDFPSTLKNKRNLRAQTVINPYSNQQISSQIAFNNFQSTNEINNFQYSFAQVEEIEQQNKKGPSLGFVQQNQIQPNPNENLKWLLQSKQSQNNFYNENIQNGKNMQIDENESQVMNENIENYNNSQSSLCMNDINLSPQVILEQDLEKYKRKTKIQQQVEFFQKRNEDLLKYLSENDSVKQSNQNSNRSRSFKFQKVNFISEQQKGDQNRIEQQNPKRKIFNPNKKCYPQSQYGDRFTYNRILDNKNNNANRHNQQENFYEKIQTESSALYIRENETESSFPQVFKTSNNHNSNQLKLRNLPFKRTDRINTFSN